MGQGVGSFVCGGKCFYQSHKDQEVSDSPKWGHMSKVYLPILCWEAASHLGGWKECRFKVGTGISTLTCLTGVGKVIQVLLVSNGYGEVVTEELLECLG